jgi:hypothetical protein
MSKMLRMIFLSFLVSFKKRSTTLEMGISKKSNIAGFIGYFYRSKYVSLTSYCSTEHVKVSLLSIRNITQAAKNLQLLS